LLPISLVDRHLINPVTSDSSFSAVTEYIPRQECSASRRIGRNEPTLPCYLELFYGPVDVNGDSPRGTHPGIR
jgi:hypothetical protein